MRAAGLVQTGIRAIHSVARAGSDLSVTRVGPPSLTLTIRFAEKRGSWVDSFSQFVTTFNVTEVLL